MAAPGQGRDDILRRSAGLPAAVVALFLAEAGRPGRGALLEAGMAELLRLAAAGGAPGAGPWPRVHALNTLRRAFTERALAPGAAAYAADGVRAAVRGAAAPDWEVRNAANLCFAALVTRAVGYSNAHRGEAPRKAVSGGEFFHRHPALHPFLLAELRAAAAALERARGALHPSLFPALLLLSRLRPSAAAAGAGAADEPLAPAAFAPVVRACARARQATVRHLAARALAPLVPPDALPAALAAALADVPAAPPVARHNRAHGALLQARVLLEAAAVAEPRLPGVAAAAGGAAPALAARAWLLGPACACAPLGAEFAAACAAALALASPAGPAAAADGEPAGAGGPAAAAAPVAPQVAELAAVLARACADAIAAGDAPGAAGRQGAGGAACGGEEGEVLGGGWAAGAAGAAGVLQVSARRRKRARPDVGAPCCRARAASVPERARTHCCVPARREAFGSGLSGACPGLQTRATPVKACAILTPRLAPHAQVGRAGALRAAAALLFSPELVRALRSAPGAGGGAWPLTVAQVGAALAHADHEVRAATLKALHAGAHLCALSMLGDSSPSSAAAVLWPVHCRSVCGVMGCAWPAAPAAQAHEAYLGGGMAHAACVPSAGDAPTLAWLPPLLHAHLHRERHPECVKAALRLLAAEREPGAPRAPRPRPAAQPGGAAAAARPTAAAAPGGAAAGAPGAGLRTQSDETLDSAARGPAAAATQGESRGGRPALGSAGGDAAGGWQPRAGPPGGSAAGPAADWRGLAAQLDATRHPGVRARCLLGLGAAAAPLVAALQRQQLSACTLTKRRPEDDAQACLAGAEGEPSWAPGTADSSGRRGAPDEAGGCRGSQIPDGTGAAADGAAGTGASERGSAAGGASAGAELAAGARPAGAAAAVSALLDAAVQAAAPAQPVEVREAAAGALGASGLLVQLPPAAGLHRPALRVPHNPKSGADMRPAGGAAPAAGAERAAGGRGSSAACHPRGCAGSGVASDGAGARAGGAEERAGNGAASGPEDRPRPASPLLQGERPQRGAEDAHSSPGRSRCAPAHALGNGGPAGGSGDREVRACAPESSGRPGDGPACAPAGGGGLAEAAVEAWAALLALLEDDEEEARPGRVPGLAHPPQPLVP